MGHMWYSQCLQFRWPIFEPEIKTSHRSLQVDIIMHISYSSGRIIKGKLQIESCLWPFSLISRTVRKTSFYASSKDQIMKSRYIFVCERETKRITAFSRASQSFILVPSSSFTLLYLDLGTK